jgi:hypothetical protein
MMLLKMAKLPTVGSFRCGASRGKERAAISLQPRDDSRCILSKRAIAYSIPRYAVAAHCLIRAVPNVVRLMKCLLIPKGIFPAMSTEVANRATCSSKGRVASPAFQRNIGLT